MYETEDHGSTVEIIVEDVEPAALFTESLLGLSDVLAETTAGTPVTHEVRLGAADLEGLMRAWLIELLRLVVVDGFVPERIDKERLESTTFSARVAGVRGVPQEEIRPVAFSEIEIKRLDDGAWAARVSLDAA
jgi:SHS2 domain-containing protein